MDFKPLADNVLVKVEAAEEKTSGGIIIPNNAKEVPNYGTVSAVGSGLLLQDGNRHKVEVSLGDKVLLVKGVGVPVEIDGEAFKVVKEYEILAVI
jgi:chaperonin GroES